MFYYRSHLLSFVAEGEEDIRPWFEASSSSVWSAAAVVVVVGGSLGCLSLSFWAPTSKKRTYYPKKGTDAEIENETPQKDMDPLHSAPRVEWGLLIRFIFFTLSAKGWWG